MEESSRIVDLRTLGAIASAHKTPPDLHGVSTRRGALAAPGLAAGTLLGPLPAPGTRAGPNVRFEPITPGPGAVRPSERVHTAWLYGVLVSLSVALLVLASLLVTSRAPVVVVEHPVAPITVPTAPPVGHSVRSGP